MPPAIAVCETEVGADAYPPNAWACGDMGDKSAARTEAKIKPTRARMRVIY